MEFAFLRVTDEFSPGPDSFSRLVSYLFGSMSRVEVCEFLMKCLKVVGDRVAKFSWKFEVSSRDRIVVIDITQLTG